MNDVHTLSYIITSKAELNASYIPFIKDGGLFIPTAKSYTLGDQVTIELQVPDKNDALIISGKVVWINHKNALHHALVGIGVQFIGSDAQQIKSTIENMLDKSIDVGGYAYGITWTEKKHHSE
jgi:type IV pilus assembly protein PilZ